MVYSEKQKVETQKVESRKDRKARKQIRRGAERK
jgi:hypothetical protein